MPSLLSQFSLPTTTHLPARTLQGRQSPGYPFEEASRQQGALCRCISAQGLLTPSQDYPWSLQGETADLLGRSNQLRRQVGNLDQLENMTVGLAAFP